MQTSIIEPKIQVLHMTIQNIRVCIDLQYVNKVLPLVLLEPIPGSPSYVAGLMNLAGKSILVIDLLMRLGLNRDKPYSLDTPILLCSDECHQCGIIVDKIIELENVDTSALQMQEAFDKPNSPFIAVVILKFESSLLINIKHVFKINLLQEKSELIFDKKLIEMSKNEKI